MAKGVYEEWLKEENLSLLTGWRRDGLKYEQIAKNIGITEKTLYEWQNKYSEISNALKKGKEHADVEVENANFKSAVGFKEKILKPIKLNKKTYTSDGKIASSEDYIEMVEEEVYYPPNPTLIIFYLKNRLPEKWKDRLPLSYGNDNQEDDEFTQSIKNAIKKLGGKDV